MKVLKEYRIRFRTLDNCYKHFYHSVFAYNIRDAWRYCRDAFPQSKLVFVSAFCSDLNQYYFKIK